MEERKLIDQQVDEAGNVIANIYIGASSGEVITDEAMKSVVDSFNKGMKQKVEFVYMEPAPPDATLEYGIAFKKIGKAIILTSVGLIGMTLADTRTEEEKQRDKAMVEMKYKIEALEIANAGLPDQNQINETKFKRQQDKFRQRAHGRNFKKR